MKNIPQVLDTMVSFEEDHTDPTQTHLVIKREQVIPQWHLDALAEIREAPHDSFGNRMVPVASIPVAIIEKWDREGYPWEDIFRGPNGPQKIIQKLKNDSLDKFLTTRKAI
jgi:hypothetical protein